MEIVEQVGIEEELELRHTKRIATVYNQSRFNLRFLKKLFVR